jgi:hypothetical protein
VIENNTQSFPSETNSNSISDKTDNIKKSSPKNLMIICGPNGVAYESMAYTVFLSDLGKLD